MIELAKKYEDTVSFLKLKIYYIGSNELKIHNII